MDVLFRPTMAMNPMSWSRRRTDYPWVVRKSISILRRHSRLVDKSQFPIAARVGNLLVTQRTKWFDAGSSAGWCVAGQNESSEENSARPQGRNGIVCFNSE